MTFRDLKKKKKLSGLTLRYDISSTLKKKKMSGLTLRYDDRHDATLWAFGFLTVIKTIHITNSWLINGKQKSGEVISIHRVLRKKNKSRKCEMENLLMVWNRFENTISWYNSISCEEIIINSEKRIR